MVISLIPCEHTHEDSYAQNASTHQHSDSDHSESEHCSPFCVCACVKGVELTESIETSILPTAEFSSIQFFAFSENLHSDFVPSFWQPPKL